MTPYQQFRRKWAKCKQCKLAKQRTSIVLARGSIPCDVLFVGEAPGASEDVIGKPFVGPAGKLLLSFIQRSVEPERLKWCLTNLVCCFPKEAKAQGVNEPPTESIKACEQRLVEFVRLCKPRAIVLVGQLPKKFVYGESQFRLDSKHPGVEWLDKPMRFAEIIHPAAILRMDISQKELACKRCIVALASLAHELSKG